jgi:hypothetical protein
LVIIYITELAYAFMPGMDFEHLNLAQKFTGHLWWIYLPVIIMTLVIPQLLWVKSIRTHLNKSLIISVLIVIGMWFERFIIIICSSERSYLASSFVNYKTSIYAIVITLGTFGFFSLMLLLIFKCIPFTTLYENKKKSIKL